MTCAGFNTPPPNPKPTIPGPILRTFAETASHVTGFDSGTLITNASPPGVNASSGSSQGGLPGSSSGANASTIGDQLMRLQPLPVTAKPNYLVPLKVCRHIFSALQLQYHCYVTDQPVIDTM